MEVERILGTKIGERIVEKELGKGAPGIVGSAGEGRGPRGGRGGKGSLREGGEVLEG